MKEEGRGFKEDENLIRFLKLTKDGKYAEIDENSLLYLRIEEETEEPYYEKEYYYSTR